MYKKPKLVVLVELYLDGQLFPLSVHRNWKYFLNFGKDGIILEGFFFTLGWKVEASDFSHFFEKIHISIEIKPLLTFYAVHFWFSLIFRIWKYALNFINLLCAWFLFFHFSFRSFSQMKPLYFSEHLGSVESFRNLINVGRGAISYINLEVMLLK